MSWGKLFGDLAKELTTDYLRERGAKGAMEDLGNVANGVKNFFSGTQDEDESSEESEELGIYDDLIQNGDYKGAIELVTEYYNGEKKDYIYYYLMGNAYLHLSLDEEDTQIAYKAKNFLQSAKNVCPIGTEDASTIKERLKEAGEAVTLIQQRKEYMTHWTNTLEKIYKLRDQDQFDNAAKALLNHYKKYDNGVLDCIYWMEMAEIHYEAHKAQTDDTKALKLFDEFVSDLEKASKMAEDTDSITRINRMKGWQCRDFKVSTEASDNKPEINLDAEKEYKDEILACLADDDEISSRERRILDKLRKSLGISEERAMQIEAECKNKGMNEQEQEYLEELRVCMADGIISAKEERLLQRLRKSLGISEERGIEIRNMIK